jgi:hypothetical protein
MTASLDGLVVCRRFYTLATKAYCLEDAPFRVTIVICRFDAHVIILDTKWYTDLCKKYTFLKIT